MRAALRCCLAGLCLLLLSTAARAAEDGLDDAARLDIEVAWLEGNLERLVEYQPRVATAQDLLCFAIRDLYWRPDPARAQAVEKQLAALSAPTPGSLLARRYAWLFAASKDTPWPVAPSANDEPWPALSLLVQDRERREALGYAPDPQLDPIRVYVRDASKSADAGDDPRLGWLSYGVDEFDSIHGDILETPEERHSRTEAGGLQMRNQLLGLLGLVALVLLSLWYARRIKLES